MILTPVKPTRIYEFGRHPNGNAVLVLKAAKLRGNIRQEGDAITASEVSEWFERYKILAQSEDMADFLDDLNLIRVTVPPKEAVPASYPLKTVQGALQVLEASLPAAVAESKAALTSAETLRSQRLRVSVPAFLWELKRLQRAVARARKTIQDDTPPVHHKWMFWHDDALLLAYRLRAIAILQGKEYSFKSIRSPAIGFIVDALNRSLSITVGRGVSQKQRSFTPDQVRKALSSHHSRELIGL